MSENKTEFMIGEDLYGLSVDELKDRIDALKSEIIRLEAEMSRKSKERDAAEQFFNHKR